jgi:hypothetical protein
VVDDVGGLIQGMQRLWRPRWVRPPTPREPWRWCSTALAERVWSMHTDRAGFRHFADDLDA